MAQSKVRAKEDLIDEAARLATQGRGLRPGQAPHLAAFVRQYYRDVDSADLLDVSVVDLHGAARAHWELGLQLRPGKPNIRVYTPSFAEDGWQSLHTIVEIVVEDMPFLVDSVTMEINRHGAGIHLAVHPVIRVVRDADGRLTEVLPKDATSGANEAFIHVEVDQVSEPAVLDELRRDLLRVLGDVRAAVTDWTPMRERARELRTALDTERLPVAAEEVAEAQALLGWLDEHFTFLGYRDYDFLIENGEQLLRPVPDTGLGILRDTKAEPLSFAKLPPETRAKARERTLLVLTKANSRATVHRPAFLDYLGVKRFDGDGNVVGERRFLGLYTSAAYSGSVLDIPVLRRKVATVLDSAGFSPASHSGKDLLQILETYPRDELFQISAQDLFDTAIGILHLQGRRRVRLFVRRDDFGRFFSCLVFVPRERYTTDVRLRIEQVLRQALHGSAIEYRARLSESVLARLHFQVTTEPGDRPDYGVGEIERRLAAVVRSWSDELRTALIDDYGEERGLALSRRYAEAFPPAYQADFQARSAVADIARLERLDPAGELGVWLYHPIGLPQDLLRLKLFRTGAPLSLSHVLPLLQDMGLEVVDERPYEMLVDGEAGAWIYDFGLRYPGPEQLDLHAVRETFQDAFLRAWRTETDSDGFNRLILQTGLAWHDIHVLRAYCKYLRQAGSKFSQDYMEDTLSHNANVAQLLVALFHARFDPAREVTASEECSRLTSEITAAVDAVASLDEDRILRSFLQLVLATLRTNYFQVDGNGEPKSYLSLKLDPASIPDLPKPRPRFEIFVHSPLMEGVHLRAGRVARGGLRWSDRREDFRTEILGLMKAQNVKNAVIVPVGAKGGFVVKRPPTGGDREALAAEVVGCYQTLIRGLLDLTDNIVEGRVVPPPQVVRHDGDDPYLVVAADKGTATFSDIANGISAEYGFWLGDAFASGGTSGYDHKKMGITARGAWESVKRHFRELGIDTQSTDFTVVGIGDMSGDVFGNGMLLSRHIRLVAAFDHRHVFLDPDPDPETSYAERQRLFGLPRSSWADYRPELISPGGGVFPRAAKSVRLSAAVQRVLGTSTEALTPSELIRTILAAPVGLLWIGGIGTYVKASAETHADVGDKANDAVRVDARDLRCRVVGEGGNLGFTQHGRIEYALAGGQINTDAIDNSAGVDCSDHEVNIKILLDAVVADGDLTRRQRDRLLAEMTDEVAELVLRDNRDQTQALSNSRAQAASMLSVYARYLSALADAGLLDRQLEFLPSRDELAERSGVGLTTPEFAVLLAYTKNTLFTQLLETDVPEDPYLSEALDRYFPTALRRRFRDRLQGHRLRREVIATAVVNDVVNAAGTTFVFRMKESTAAPLPDVVRAWTAAREVFGMRALAADIEALDNRVAAATQTAMLLEARKLGERATRWLIRNRRSPLDVGAVVATFGPGVSKLAERLVDLLCPSDRTAYEHAAEKLVTSGVPIGLAGRVAGLGQLYSALDIVDISRRTDRPVEEVGRLYFGLDDRLQLGWLLDRIIALPRADRWQALARAAQRDDLYGAHRELTAAVLDSGEPELSMDQRVEAWLVANRTAVDRALQVLRDVQAAGATDLTALSVVLREVRSLTQAQESITA